VGHWDVLRIANVSETDVTAENVLAFAQNQCLKLETYPVEVSPFLRIEGEWDAYLASRNKKFRYKLRQRSQMLQDNPDLFLGSYNSLATVPSLIQEIISIDRRSWKAKYGLDIASKRNEKQYYSALLP